MRNKTLFLILVLLLSAALLSACGTPLAAQPVLAQATEASKRTINSPARVKSPSPGYRLCLDRGPYGRQRMRRSCATNTSQAQKVVDALKAFKIDPKDIQTTNFSIYP